MQVALDWTQPVVKAQCWKQKKQVVSLLGHRAQRCLAKRSAVKGPRRMTGLVWTVGCSKAARSTLLHRTYWNKSIGRCSVADDCCHYLQSHSAMSRLLKSYWQRCQVKQWWSPIGDDGKR